MVFAMHNSEGGKQDSVSDFIGTLGHPLNYLPLRNMFYSGNYITRCQENDYAKNGIKSFLA